MLSPAQLQTLKADLQTNTNTILISGVATPINTVASEAFNAVPKNVSFAQEICNQWYNLPASPSFWVWLSTSTLAAVGMAIKMSDVGNLTTANSTRLQVSFQVRPGGFTPANQDDRSLFGGLFSVSGASGTRANLLAIWQRLATRIEKMFATGTGTQVTGDLNSDGSVTVGSPGVLVVDGSTNPLTGNDVLEAWGS